MGNLHTVHLICKWPILNHSQWPRLPHKSRCPPIKGIWILQELTLEPISQTSKFNWSMSLEIRVIIYRFSSWLTLWLLHFYQEEISEPTHCLWTNLTWEPILHQLTEWILSNMTSQSPVLLLKLGLFSEDLIWQSQAQDSILSWTEIKSSSTLKITISNVLLPVQPPLNWRVKLKQLMSMPKMFSYLVKYLSKSIKP